MKQEIIVNSIELLKRMRITFLVLIIALFSFSSVAQNLTPQQLQQVRNLTPQQKQQLIQLLEGGASGATEVSDDIPVAITQVQAAVPAPDKNDERVRMRPFDSVVIELNQIEDTQPLFESIRSVLGSRMYQLDSAGYVELPVVGRVLLYGLNAEEARIRLMAEPALRELEIGFYFLPVKPAGNLALEVFGNNLFEKNPATVGQVVKGGRPAGYTLGPGDEVIIVYYGQQNARHQLVVDRDGQVFIPEVGPIGAAGQKFEVWREDVVKQIESRFIGAKVAVTLGRLRSVQVFVSGDVRQPGQYVVDGFSTITNVLRESGGIAPQGSMRQVQLKRNGRLVGTLDLYDILLKGDTRRDLQVRQGDVVFVPTAGDQVSVYGAVSRPAIYELNGSSNLGDLLDLAGGLGASADKQRIRIERFGGNGDKVVESVSADLDSMYPITDGDEIVVSESLEEFGHSVRVLGHIKRPIELQWRPGLRVLDVISDHSSFKEQADRKYSLIRRSTLSTGRISLLSFNWTQAKKQPQSEHNIELSPGDTIHVFSLEKDRAMMIAPLLKQIKNQATNTLPAQIVRAQGHVRAEGDYPFESRMRVSDLLRASGSVRNNAYLESAELTRMTRHGSDRTTHHLPINLHGLVPGSENDLLLESEDVLTVKELPIWRQRQQVQLSGEILFPGIYTAYRGERLSEVINRAGGATEMAFLSGSIFLRKDLIEREQEQIEVLSRRIRTEILALGESQIQSKGRAEALLDQLESTKPMGRLVIDLGLAMQGHPEHDVVLEDGDHLVIPQQSQEVTVIGEVQYPTSHIFTTGLDQRSYIAKSGGLTSNADSRRIYIIRADGLVVARPGSNWFNRSSNATRILAGDTIVVPLDADRISQLSLWTSVSQVIYNIGVAAAAVASF